VSTGRYQHLDGLRGVAALAVAFCHFAYAFQPALLSGNPAQGAAAATGLSKTPLILLWSPDCAVMVFFVLSGFVLQASVAGAPGDSPALRLLSSVLRRWVRLAGPILGSSLLIWLVVAAGGLRNAPAAASNGSSWLAMHFGWLAWQSNSLPALVEQSLFGIFATATHWWNAALWTMPVEFWGSVGIFVFHAALGRAPGWMRASVLVAVTAGLLSGLAGTGAANGAGFGFGALLWEGRRWVAAPGRLAWWAGAATFTAGVVLGGMPYDLLGTPYWPGFVLASAWLTEPVLAAHRLGAGLLVLAALAWPPLGWALRRRPVLALGRVSFMVYLLHIILICSLASWLVLRLTPAWGYDAATATALVATLAVLFPLATAMTWAADRPAIVWSRQVERMVLTLQAPANTTRPSKALPSPSPSGRGPG
ncbi:MAG: acyltransferase family protein, partial [Janthinobacterium lividum]